MKKETSNQTIDKCKHCGAEITYDSIDGYWDSFYKEGSDQRKFVTPWCKEDEPQLHEPINHIKDDHGFYFIKDDDNRQNTKTEK